MADRPGGGRVVSHRAQALVGGKHHELTCARSSARQDCRIAITMAVLQNEVNGMRKQILLIVIFTCVVHFPAWHLRRPHYELKQKFVLGGDGGWDLPDL